MRAAIAPLVIGVALALSTDLGASVVRTDPQPRWCPVARARATPPLNQRLDVKPVLARFERKPGPTTPRPTPKVQLARIAPPPRLLPHALTPQRPAPMLVRFAPALFATPLYLRMTASCIGDRVSILCPGYQVIGTEY